MTDIHVTPEGFRKYGDIATAMAVHTGTAGLVDQAATVTAAAPIFGLIGMEYLGSFAVAQANHLGGVVDLTKTHESTATTAYLSAAVYEAAEHMSARGFTQTSQQL